MNPRAPLRTGNSCVDGHPWDTILWKLGNPTPPQKQTKLHDLDLECQKNSWPEPKTVTLPERRFAARTNIHRKMSFGLFWPSLLVTQQQIDLGNEWQSQKRPINAPSCKKIVPSTNIWTPDGKNSWGFQEPLPESPGDFFLEARILLDLHLWNFQRESHQKASPAIFCLFPSQTDKTTHLTSWVSRSADA